MKFTFYLGTHRPQWLQRTDVPLFLSDRTLRRSSRTFPLALGPWALDSGGFSELSMLGKWETTAGEYADRVRRYQGEIGRLEWAAVQDWMCEPTIRAKTGLSVEEHQERTIDSFERLRDLAPRVPWAPVLQGWTPGDYERHLDSYAKRGIDLKAAPALGVGSICRRQNVVRILILLSQLRAAGFENLHAFGFKIPGLKTLREAWKVFPIASSDSMAWSSRARRSPPLPECRGHKNCANCLLYALEWRERVIAVMRGSGQGIMDFGGS